MNHKWENYFDTESEYWKKIQKIYEENDNYPKVVVKNRNLHHKFMRSFSRLEGTEIDNDKDNLVSLSEGDHFLVHYYLWKCTKTGFKNRTALPVRLMYKKAAKYITDEIAETIAKEWTCKGYKGQKRSEETKKRMSESNKGKKLSEETKKRISESLKGNTLSEETKRKISKYHKGKKLSEETKKRISESHKGKNMSEEAKKKISEAQKGKKVSEETRKKISEFRKGVPSGTKGKHWKFVDGKRVYY